MHLGADLGGGYPALGAAFPERAPEDGLLGLLGHGDVAGHAKQLEHELLLGKEIGHRWRTSCSYSEGPATPSLATPARSEEHTSELQSLMRISYAVFCLKKNKT